MAQPRARDFQRSRLYEAEDAAPPGRRLADLDTVQRFVEGVVESSTWRQLGGPPAVVVQVRDGRGRRSACAEASWHGGIIRVPRWARCERIVLHELAHLLTPDVEPAHGPRFVAHYVALARRFLDPIVARRLEEALHAKQVAVAAPLRVAPDERQRVIQRIRELFALAAGTDSEHEAASAAARAQRLLLEHDLTTAEIEADAGREPDPLVEEKRSFAAQLRRVPVWKQMLLCAVARGTLCEWITSFYGDAGPRTYSFIGRQANVEVASFLFRSLERQIEDQWRIQRSSLRQAGRRPQRHRTSFCEGLVAGIEERLGGERERFERGGERPRALVRARDREAAEFRRKLYPDVVYRTERVWVDGAAHAAGREAARNVRIQHALGADARPRRGLPPPSS